MDRGKCPEAATLDAQGKGAKEDWNLTGVKGK